MNFSIAHPLTTMDVKLFWKKWSETQMQTLAVVISEVYLIYFPKPGHILTCVMFPSGHEGWISSTAILHISLKITKLCFPEILSHHDDAGRNQPSII